MPRYERPLAERIRRVQEAWERLEEADPEISTEMLLSRIAEETGEAYGDVPALVDGEDPASL
jgi:hypothetical protein